MPEPSDGERADLLDAYGFQRMFLLGTVERLSDDQARQRTTVSELSLGGLFKHDLLRALLEWRRIGVDRSDRTYGRRGGGRLPHARER